MITINNFGRAGRLGNQIFQYSLLFYLNKTKGYEIHLPLEVDCQFWKCFDLQNINVKQYIRDGNYRLFYERYGSCNFDDLVLQQSDNTIFDGYYQSYMYFDAVKQELINSLKFKQHIIDEGNLELQKYNNKNLVSIHIRRTDYLDHVNVWGDLFADGYYKEIEKFTSENDNILIFTDDNNFAKHHFNKPNHHVIEKNEYVSLYMMSKCNRSIISNSSFAWWGAYLTGHDNIICPQPWWPKSHPGVNSIQKNITKPEWMHIKCFNQKGT